MNDTKSPMIESLERRRMLAAQPYDWKSVTIKANGFIDGIVYHPAQQNLVYMHTDMGGAYRWDQPLARWTPLNDWAVNDDFPTKHHGVETMAVDPTDPNRVYMSVGTYGSPAAIMRSTDQGRTWLRTDVNGINANGNGSARNAGERMNVDPNSPNILYYGTRDDGLWKSTDYGATWADVAAFPTIGEDGGVEADTGIVWTLFDKSSSTAGTPTQVIYAGVVHYAAGVNRIYRTTNGGTSWEAVPGGQPTTLNYFPQRAALTPDGNTLYLTYGFSNEYPGPYGITEGMVYKTANPDAASPTWTHISPPVNYGFSGVAIDPTSPNTVYVTELGNYNPADRIWRSTNGGTSWTSISPNSNRNDSSAPYVVGMGVHWMGDLQVDPFNRNVAMFTTGYGLYRTSNLTATTPTWTFFNEGFEQSAVLELASPNTGAVNLFSAIGDRDGYRHENFAVSPAGGRLGQSQGLTRGTSPDIDVAFNNANYMVRVVAGDPYVQYSNNNGVTWAWFSDTTGATQQGGNIAISSDGTRAVFDPGGAEPPRYATRSGNAWSDWLVPAANRPADGAEVVADTVATQTFFAYAGTTVWRSTDGGANWTVMTTTAPSGGGWIRSVPGQTGHLLMTRGGSGLWRSTNDGANWSQLGAGVVTTASHVGVGAGPTPASYPSIYVSGTVSTQRGFFRSDDQGATWITISDLAHQYGQVSVIQGDPRVYGRLYVGSNGRGILYGEIHQSPGAIPAAWTSADIGSVGSTGAAGQTAGVWELIGGGAGVSGTTDAFRFAYQELSGNVTITARVIDVPAAAPGNNDAKAGVMIRSTLAGNSANAFVALTPGSANGVMFTARTGNGAGTGTIAGATTNVWPPYWVRLTRSGNTLTAFRSADGVNWLQLGTPQTIALGTNVLVGLAVTASDANNLNISRFEQVSVTQPAPVTATVAPVTPDPRGGGVPSFTITFSEAVTGFDLDDLSLTRDGAAVGLAGATLNSADGGVTWTLGGTTLHTDELGSYALALNHATANITATATATGAGMLAGASDAWIMNVLSGTPAADLVRLVRNGADVEYWRGNVLQYAFNPAPFPELVVSGLNGSDELTLTGAVDARLAGTSRLHALALTGGARLDIGAASLALDTGDVGAWNGAAYSGLTALLVAGWNEGTWTGASGIVSSAAAAETSRWTIGIARAADVLDFSVEQTVLWAGQTVTESSALLHYTYVGDANIDGSIDGGDYAYIDSYVGAGGGDVSWLHGDFNYDGSIDGGDYAYIDVNVGSPPMPPADGTFSAAGAIREEDDEEPTPESNLARQGVLT